MNQIEPLASRVPLTLFGRMLVASFLHLQYMDQIQPVASRVPWMVGVGNHERDFPTASKSPTRPDLSYFTGDDSGGDCGVPTAFR